MSMAADCERFYNANHNDLALAQKVVASRRSTRPAPGDTRVRLYGMPNAGHDFWLSRNGHGAGFFDRGKRKSGVCEIVSRPIATSAAMRSFANRCTLATRGRLTTCSSS